MSIRLKVAHTAKELDDVFKLRYDVYVVNKGRFSLDSSSCENKGRIVDRFDTIPDATNIIAYNGNEPVACIRVNKDSEIGLPPEVYFDFSNSRQEISLLNNENPGSQLFVSSGMLAVKEEWRNRRNIIHALLKTAIATMHSYGGSHVMISISEETQSLYGRMGFEAIGQSRWCESVGDKLTPMIAPLHKVFKWAFGDFLLEENSIWFHKKIKSPFERILLSKGESLFYQGDKAKHAYVIEEGWISISKTDDTGNEMVLSNLSKGEIFGELAIFDHNPRSATATALSNTEVMVISHKYLLAMIKENPDCVGKLLSNFAKRLRDMDDQAMMQVFAPQAVRIQFELEKLWHSAVPDRKGSHVRLAKIGPKQIARSAHVPVDDVVVSLEFEQTEGNIEFGKQSIRFLKKPIVNGGVHQ